MLHTSWPKSCGNMASESELVAVYVRPAKDHFELNLEEARTLSRLYSAHSELVSGDAVVFWFPREKAPRFLWRLCGSREAGIDLGEFGRADLVCGLRKASELVGTRRYKVSVEPDERDLIREAVAVIGPNVDVGDPDVVVHIGRKGDAYALRLRFKTARVRLSRLQPKSWVYFHPGALQPFFCGLMCNLAACSERGLLLDPFCGVGSTLVAASKLGLRAVGLDLSKKQAYGCRRNLLALGLGDADVLRADAANMPLKRSVFDAAAFDPPYGKVSSLFGRSFGDLIDEAAGALWGVLKPYGHACFFVPEGSEGIERFVSRGFKLTFTFTIPVHRSLTRILVVAQKVV